MNDFLTETNKNPSEANPTESKAPVFNLVKSKFDEAKSLVDDIILKNYLKNLNDLEIVPLDDSTKNISDIRIFKITEMVYQKDEYSTYKFASVFNAVQNLNCGVFVIVDSDGKKTDIYMGIRAHDDRRTAKSLKDTLKNALCGQFPGVKTIDLLDAPAEEFLKNINTQNIAAVSCIAQNKNDEFIDNKKFLQGLEKLLLAMQGQRYSAVFLANSTPVDVLHEIRWAYENVYTNLSPFANINLSYGTSVAMNISTAFSNGMTQGSSVTTNTSTQTGKSYSKTTSTNESKSSPTLGGIIAKGLTAAGAIVAAPFTGGASLVVGSLAMNAIPGGSKTVGKSESESINESFSNTFGVSESLNENRTQSQTQSKGSTSSTNDNMQLTMQNKSLINTLDRIDKQLKRIEECESLGMWESAAYFLSGSQETTEMAAGMYKALMNGERSGVESSAINFWGRSSSQKLNLIREYILNFIHPVFEYRSPSTTVPVTASSLVSGNELAIQMGFPRNSVRGFPVIEHAEFGKEVVKYTKKSNEREFILGSVFNMGEKSPTEVRLDRDSMTMHTFITGSTGSGKSNTVYELVNQLRSVYNIPFLIIEPTKGEYKNVFGQFKDVQIYGTNPKINLLLKINPFRFSKDVHILEHVDRIVEIFNVCWPMYAAMPAILKESIENAYVISGWNLTTSENAIGLIYPNFSDILEQIEDVVNNSRYSSDTKGDYAGALCTRVKSLTNGINGLIFTQDDLTDNELFERSVIVDLSRVGSTETKSLIMGLLVMRLNEYRMTSGRHNSSLKHITILEEAHTLLKRTFIEQSSETSNLVGKSVELLANSIAELRTYGEGFIIVDQSPGLLDLSVIRNTNTKIILRLPEQTDRELVGFAAGLNKEQIEELTKLERGVAAVYQNDWIEPVLVKVNKCNINEMLYDYCDTNKIADPIHLKKQIILFLIQGRVQDDLPFDLDEIQTNIGTLNLTVRNREFLEDQISEFRNSGNLEIWKDKNLAKLASKIVEIMQVRLLIENIVIDSADYIDLNQKLAKLIYQIIPNAGKSVMVAISQCLMKDFSIGKNESDQRERLYMNWIDSIHEKGGQM